MYIISTKNPHYRWRSPALIWFPTPPHLTIICISGRPPIGRLIPRLAGKAPQWSPELEVILGAFMWIRESHIRIVYPQKHLGALVFILRRSRVIRMKLPRQFSVSPLYILCSRWWAYCQNFIKIPWFHVTVVWNGWLCAHRGLHCSGLETPPKSNMSAPGAESCRRSLEANMTSAWKSENIRRKYKRRSHYWYIIFFSPRNKACATSIGYIYWIIARKNYG